MDSVRYALLMFDTPERIEALTGEIKGLHLMGITLDDALTIETSVEHIEVQQLTSSKAGTNTVNDCDLSSESL